MKSEESISSSDLLLLSLTKYYSKNNKFQVIKDIIENKSNLSLRLIDWYVTNYCKHHNVAYILNKKNNKEYFNVYMNYRSQLKAFKKILFDPFRRRSRIKFFYEKDYSIFTTIGQLNFFRWAIDSQIITNLQANLQEVEADMLKRQKTDKDKSSKETSSGDAKKQQNSTSAPSTAGGKKKKKTYNTSINTMTTFNGSTLISFR